MYKICTSIEQSKKLIELGIDINTSDMMWVNDGLGKPFPAVINKNLYEDDTPCWSIAALLNLLPNEIVTDNKFECHYQIDIRKYDGGNNTTLYQIAYGNNRGSSGSWHDMINTGEKEHLIDACFQILVNLNELNLL